MVYSFKQTDTASICPINVYCSGRSLSANVNKPTRKATFGASPGSTSTAVGVDYLVTLKVCVNFELVVDNGVTWAAGTWTVRFNVTTASNLGIWLEEVHICRVNSSCVSQETIGSTTGIHNQMNSTGVRTISVTGIAQAPSVGDKVIIVLVFTNDDNHGNGFNFTPNQDVDSPFTLGGPLVFINNPLGV